MVFGRSTISELTAPSSLDEGKDLPKTDLKRRIVIVDDDKTILETLGFILSEHPQLQCETILFSGGNPAIEFFEKHPDLRIDLVLCDVRMPDGDGVTFLKRFRRIYPKTSFYLMTGYMDITFEKAVDQGAQGVLHKPFNPFKTVSELLKLNLKLGA